MAKFLNMSAAPITVAGADVAPGVVFDADLANPETAAEIDALYRAGVANPLAPGQDVPGQLPGATGGVSATGIIATGGTLPPLYDPATAAERAKQHKAKAAEEHKAPAKK